MTWCNAILLQNITIFSNEVSRTPYGSLKRSIRQNQIAIVKYHDPKMANISITFFEWAITAIWFALPHLDFIRCLLIYSISGISAFLNVLTWNCTKLTCRIPLIHPLLLTVPRSILWICRYWWNERTTMKPDLGQRK